MYLSTSEIKERMFNKEAVEWKLPFNVYHKTESHKWDESHFLRKVEDYKKLHWIKGNIKVCEILDIQMNIAGWIRRLSCGNKNCLSFAYQNCDCNDNENRTSTTLRKTVKNYYANSHLNDFKRIENIKEAIENGQIDELTIIIRCDFNPYSIEDGNNRLIALATMPSMCERAITCYLGER